MNIMELIFRKIDETNTNDIAQFNTLMDDLTTHTGNQSLLLDHIKKINTREDAYLMVAEDTATGTLCGTLLAVLLDDFCDDCLPMMIIENVVTHHDYRQKGIARRMFQEIETWGRNKKVNYINLSSSLNRTDAHAFYRNIGYEEVKGFRKYL